MIPSRDDTFMEVASVMARRSTCNRGQVGAIIVKDNRIISTGYNGSPPGMDECIEVGCKVQVLYEWDEGRSQYLETTSGCQRAIHAEANSLMWAAKHGLAVEGATMYCTHGPCLHCAQLMSSAGIVRVVFGIPYRLPQGLDLLWDMGVETHEYVG